MNSSFVVSAAKSSMDVFEGDQKRTRVDTFSTKEFEKLVNFCVRTHTEIPMRLPENASSVRLPDRLFTSVQAAQSSRMK